VVGFFAAISCMNYEVTIAIDVILSFTSSFYITFST
jgi:hypothetical protein